MATAVRIRYECLDHHLIDRGYTKISRTEDVKNFAGYVVALYVESDRHYGYLTEKPYKLCGRTGYHLNILESKEIIPRVFVLNTNTIRTVYKNFVWLKVVDDETYSNLVDEFCSGDKVLYTSHLCEEEKDEVKKITDGFEDF